MESPKDRANDSNRKSAQDHTDSELLEKFNDLHKKLSAQPKSSMTFADDPGSRNTGWFFGGK
jgi:hypothetical protein